MKEMRIEDVMTTPVVVVKEDTPFKDVVRTMRQSWVSAVPVVDRDERLVGIVSEADLLRVEEEGATGPRSVFLEWYVSPAYVAEVQRRAEHLRARDVMTPDVVTIEPGTTVAQGVRRLLRAEVKRLPVVDEDGRVVGIVSRRDLLVPFLRPDDELRREIVEDVIHRTMWLDPATIDVQVAEGVVTLGGAVERRSEREILESLVRRVGGVVGVENELTYRIDDRELRIPPPSHPEIGWSENWVRSR